jgi:hypothetical protein
MPPLDPVREHRIREEIIVDAYSSEEQALGWYYYLEGALAFPFRARCVRRRATTPLQVGEEVEVSGMASEDECFSEMFVTVRWQQHRLAVPLTELEVVPGSAMGEESDQALADWHYWLSQGYSF